MHSIFSRKIPDLKGLRRNMHINNEMTCMWTCQGPPPPSKFPHFLCFTSFPWFHRPLIANLHCQAHLTHYFHHSLSVFCLSLCPSISHLIFLFLYLIKLSETDTIKALQNKYQIMSNSPEHPSNPVTLLVRRDLHVRIKDEWLKMIKYVPNQMLSNKWGKYICIKTWISKEKDLIFVHINKSLRDHLDAQQDLCYADCLVVTLLTLECSKLLRCVCVCTRAKRHRYVEGCLANFLSNVKVPLNLNRIPLSWTPYQIYLGLAFCALQSNKSNKRFSWDKFTSCWLRRLKHNIWNGNDMKMFNTIFRIISFLLFPFLFGCCCCFLGYFRYSGSFIILQTYPNFRGCCVRARDYHV